MKKILVIILSLLSIISIWFIIKKVIEPNYRRDARHFYFASNGRCVTMWRTVDRICYVIPGVYMGTMAPPPSQSYISSPFTKGLDIIYPRDTDGIIVMLEDEKSQSIHQSPDGVRLINYDSNKALYDSVYLYNDGTYNRYKNNVDFISLDILEEHANGRHGEIKDSIIK